MIRLTPVTREDVLPLIEMTVRDDQQDYVSPNVKTLAQAAYEPGAEVFAIRDGETLVGLVAWIDLRKNPYREDGEDDRSGYIWRLVISPEHQGKGYGRSATEQIIAHARTAGVSRIFISAIPENTLAIGLYERLGFASTGRVIDGELQLRLEFEA